jgi:hypothetical protein
MQATVFETLSAYRRGGQYKANSVFIGGKDYLALDISPEDLQILAGDLDTLLDHEANPEVADIIARGSPRILDAVRLVNVNTKQGYKGSQARGMALCTNPLVPGDLKAASSASAKTNWLTTVSTAAAANYSGDSTNVNNMVVSSLPVLAHVILGFVNPIEVPKMDRIQLIKNGDPWVYEALTYGWRAQLGTYHTPVYELKQPWIIPPGEKYYIACQYIITGDDKTQPIAFAIKRATDIIAALA